MMDSYWEPRYRALERQMSALLVFVQRRMATLERAASEAIEPSDEPRVREMLLAPDHSVVCIADGKDLEYRFIISLGDRTISDTGFGRRNSVSLRQPGNVKVKAQVRSRLHPPKVVEGTLQRRRSNTS
ncbi:hypothetical protein [Tessaracoccus sp. ZS01]|uniref:hypothetical protein n=1 Tax=Tessaracoccus sp. ZS01 TaxID=1906324 RepID=UPI00096F7A46|nr:hypothetical protein [Tessaracoccus sp. ZS01]MCG6568038.1 hypothetical protein [Tessaracoccus sp. ZS01]OMG54298.1 hypothetical protein BJN44_10485 [Tessaracoccus sp. ZS01]